MTAKNALELSQHAHIKVPAKDLLAMAQNARHYAELLIEKHFWMEGIAYLSHAITPRESIWWAWFCARKASLPKNEPAGIQALALAEAWIGQPVDENRKNAGDFAERLPDGSAPQAVLKAIFCTGETINEVTGERIPVIPYMSGKFVNVAVLTSVYEVDPEKPETVAGEFLKQGMDVADRIQVWAKYA
jgi:hypothetical protein